MFLAKKMCQNADKSYKPQNIIIYFKAKIYAYKKEIKKVSRRSLFA